MADLEHHAGALGGLDHRLRLLDADRHRLLGQDVLFRGADLRDMLGMQLGRRRDIDRVERRSRSIDGRSGCTAAPVSAAAVSRISGVGFGDGRQLERRIAANRRNKRPAGRPHPDDSDTDFAGHTCSYGARLVTLAARE